MDIVLATANEGKVREFRRLLEPLPARILSLDDASISDVRVPPVEETGLTFVENALIKARNAARHTGLPSIADDSGLVVPALGGAPGIRSARYAGDGASAAANNRKVAADLQHRSAPAYFYCALAFLRDADDPTPVLATGIWHGTFVPDPRGDAGFGYDPHFWLDEAGCTAAELGPTRKNACSHRARAADALLEQLRTVLAP